MIIKEDIYKQILGTTKEDFINKNMLDLKTIFPIKEDIIFSALYEYYSSDAYSANLLLNLEDIIRINSLNQEFLDIISKLSHFSKLNILCYRGQYSLIPELLKLGYNITCIDFPHKVFKLYKEIFKDMDHIIRFIPIEEEFNLPEDIMYDVIISQSIWEHELDPVKLFKKFEGMLELGNILYISFDPNNNFEHLHNFNTYDILEMVNEYGFMFPLRKNRNILIKLGSLSGVKRFRFTDRHVVASIQKEIFTNTINAIYSPEICINVGGPPKEFCNKSISIDITGEPDIFAEGEHLPFKNNSIDLVYSCHSLEHMRNTRDAIREWLRVLKEGGILSIIVPVLPYHRHSNKIALGETCFEEHTIEEYKQICDEFNDISELRQFNVRKNDFDIDIVLLKK